eukprot:7530315-Pyramimonas_sp.AAC.1
MLAPSTASPWQFPPLLWVRGHPITAAHLGTPLASNIPWPRGWLAGLIGVSNKSSCPSKHSNALGHKNLSRHAANHTAPWESRKSLLGALLGQP